MTKAQSSRVLTRGGLVLETFEEHRLAVLSRKAGGGKTLTVGQVNLDEVWVQETRGGVAVYASTLSTKAIALPARTGVLGRETAPLLLKLFRDAGVDAQHIAANVEALREERKKTTSAPVIAAG